MTDIADVKFCARLSTEMAALTPQEISEILVRVGHMDQRMRANGQERPVWRGPASEPEVLGREVSIETDHGTRVGRAICFGIVQVGLEYERSVVVHVAASGTHHEVPGSMTKLAGSAELARMDRETMMADRLRAAALDPTIGMRKPSKRGPRVKNDPRIIGTLLDLADQSTNVRNLEEGMACHKITGKNADRKIYLFKQQMRCNLSGFTVAHSAVRTLSAEEARDMHLGSVRGQISFEDPMAAKAAFALALDELGKTTTEGTEK